MDSMSLDRRRCPHCVGGLATFPLDGEEGFAAPGPVVFCHRCDRATADEQPLFLPGDWE